MYSIPDAMAFDLARWLLAAGIKEEKVPVVVAILCTEDYDTPDRLRLLTESNIKDLPGLNASQRASIHKAVAALPPPGAAIAVPASRVAADTRAYNDTSIAASGAPASAPYYVQQRQGPSLAVAGSFTYSFFPASRCVRVLLF